MAGVALISFNGSRMELNPMGDLLAVLAAFVWACYSILTRKISSFGYPVILTTRRTFFYGILFMVPVITVVTSVLVLKEPVTWVSIMGTVLAVAGLFLSEYNREGSGNSE